MVFWKKVNNRRFFYAQLQVQKSNLKMLSAVIQKVLPLAGVNIFGMYIKTQIDPTMIRIFNGKLSKGLKT